MEQDDGNRGNASRAELVDDGRDRSRIGSLQDRAGSVDTLDNLQPQRAWDERVGRRGEEVVDVVELLAAELENVAKAAGRDQCRRCPLALDQRVGDEGGRVDGKVDRRRVEASAGHFLPAANDATGWVTGVGQHLVAGGDSAGRGVNGDEVGEGAADIE